MITEADTIIRLFLAAFLGALVGLERERHNQPAGLRTHTILAIGSALAMCVSIALAMDFREWAPNGDPARLAAQVISGIGFLGAGAIIRFGKDIKGLTTSTSLWTVAVIGLAVGAGHFFSAFSATILLLGTLILLDKLEKKVIVGTSTRSITIRVIDRPGFVHSFQNTLAGLDIEAKAISFRKSVERGELEIVATAKIRAQQNLDRLIELISRIEGVQSFSVD